MHAPTLSRSDLCALRGAFVQFVRLRVNLVKLSEIMLVYVRLLATLAA